MKIIKRQDKFNKTDMENLKENQYFACIVYGASWQIKDEERKYMTDEQYYKRLLCQPTNEGFYITKKYNYGFCNEYGCNCIVELEPNEIANCTLLTC